MELVTIKKLARSRKNWDPLIVDKLYDLYKLKNSFGHTKVKYITSNMAPHYLNRVLVVGNDLDLDGDRTQQYIAILGVLNPLAPNGPRLFRTAHSDDRNIFAPGGHLAAGVPVRDITDQEFNALGVLLPTG
jgi:hypothetical protein